MSAIPIYCQLPTRPKFRVSDDSLGSWRADWTPVDIGQLLGRGVWGLQKAVGRTPRHCDFAQLVKQPMRIELLVFRYLFCSLWCQGTENLGSECERG